MKNPDQTVAAQSQVCASNQHFMVAVRGRTSKTWMCTHCGATRAFGVSPT